MLLHCIMGISSMNDTVRDRFCFRWLMTTVTLSSEQSRTDKAMFIYNHNVHSIERTNMHLCALCHVHHNLKGLFEKNASVLQIKHKTAIYIHLMDKIVGYYIRFMKMQRLNYADDPSYFHFWLRNKIQTKRFHSKRSVFFASALWDFSTAANKSRPLPQQPPKYWRISALFLYFERSSHVNRSSKPMLDIWTTLMQNVQCEPD